MEEGDTVSELQRVRVIIQYLHSHINTNSGGDLTFFLVERSNNGQMSNDLLACGMGQWGALGNGLYTTAQGTPTKVRAVSGLLECECAFSFILVLTLPSVY